MNKQTILNLINKTEIKKIFAGGVNINITEEIEKDLNVILPESYKWFLKEFGHGGLAGLILNFRTISP